MLKDNWKFDAMYPMYVVEFQTNIFCFFDEHSIGSKKKMNKYVA